jgi:hypothetical protein
MNDYSTIVQALTKHRIRVKFRARSEHAGVAELADALRSGRSEHYARVGSNPTFGTSLRYLENSKMNSEFSCFKPCVLIRSKYLQRAGYSG